MKRLAILLLVVAVQGCAYYNGMYNANRLARAAEKAEREGRTFEATSLWGQVGVKVDTVLARHSGSKWADDARLLRGKSYQRLGDCNGAITVLKELLATSVDSAITEEGAFLLGRCYQTLGNVDGASTAFQRLVTSADPSRRKEALYQYGRSLRMGGRYQDALLFLDLTDDPRSAGERAAALAGVGRFDEAEAAADSLIAAGDTIAPWDSMLAVMGRQDARRASKLTDRLLAMPEASAGRRAGWLFADGERLLPSSPDTAVVRVTQAIELSPDGPVAPYGRLFLLRARMMRVAAHDSLRTIRTDLDDLVQSSGPTGIQLGRYMRASSFVLLAVDSASLGATAADLRLFLAAEIARDSLEMPRLAGRLFSRIVEEHQTSPYAAKALLALGALNGTAADSTDAVLAGRYPQSPYYLAFRGQDAPGFTALEDSLLKFADAMRRASRPVTPPRQQTPAPGARLPQN